jgi:hypothetical protein
MEEAADIGKVVADQLGAEGLIPTDGVMVVVEHVTIARVTVLTPVGGVDTHFRTMWSSTIDPGTQVDMAHRIADEAQRRMGI